MNEILALFFSPIFWIGSVFVGLILSVVGNLATDGLKQFWGKYSASQRDRNEKYQQAVVAEARKCLASTPRLIVVQSRLSLLYQKAIVNYVLACFCFTSGFLAFMLIAILVGVPHPEDYSLSASTFVNRALFTAEAWGAFVRILAPSNGAGVMRLMALVLMAVGLFPTYNAGRAVSRSHFWRRVLNRTSELLDEQDAAVEKQATDSANASGGQ